MRRSRTASRDRSTADVDSVPDHHFPQIWFLLISTSLFGLYVAWDLRLLSTMFALDKSYVTSLILALVIIASSHAAWHIFLFSRRIKYANHLLQNYPQATSFKEYDIFIQDFVLEVDNDIAMNARHRSQQNSQDNDSLLDIYADQLRSPVDLGWYLVDLAVRLGLLGTIIGFILIFTSLSDTTIEGSEGLKDLLVTMSGGMGTALFTTLGGLVGGTFLSLQYLILGREVEQLIGSLVRIRSRLLAQPKD